MFGFSRMRDTRLQESGTVIPSHCESIGETEMPGATTKTTKRVRKHNNPNHTGRKSAAQSKPSPSKATRGLNRRGAEIQEPISDQGWGALRREDFWSKLRNHSFWLDRRDQFKRLPDTLCADWVAADQQWTIHGSTAEARTMFESEALTAVGELRALHPTSGSDPLVEWLNLLKTNRHSFQPITEEACRPEGETFKGTGGMIRCLPKASAACSLALANQASRNIMASQAAARDAIQVGPEGAQKLLRQYRAQTVAKLIGELNDLKPQMMEDEAEYARLRANYPKYLAFEIADRRPDLKMKILNIRGSSRHIRLAQELAAAHHGRGLWTIKDDWKRSKPPEFRRQP